jgi:hypothetical protein
MNAPSYVDDRIDSKPAAAARRFVAILAASGHSSTLFRLRLTPSADSIQLGNPRHPQGSMSRSNGSYAFTAAAGSSGSGSSARSFCDPITTLAELVTRERRAKSLRAATDRFTLPIVRRSWMARSSRLSSSTRHSCPNRVGGSLLPRAGRAPAPSDPSDERPFERTSSQNTTTR